MFLTLISQPRIAWKQLIVFSVNRSFCCLVYPSHSKTLICTNKSPRGKFTLESSPKFLYLNVTPFCTPAGIFTVAKLFFAGW